MEGTGALLFVFFVASDNSGLFFYTVVHLIIR